MVLNEVFGDVKGCAKGHKPRADAGLNFCFCVTEQTFPWAGDGI